MTAVNKNSLRRSHCANVGRLVHSLSLPTKETDTPPTPPSVDFSRSLLVLLKIVASSCCDGAHVAKRASVVGGCSEFSRQSQCLYLEKVKKKVKKSHPSLVEHIQGKATLHSVIKSTIPSPLLMKVIDRTSMESTFRSDGIRPNSEAQREADCEG